jgi:hypothetical protein
VKAGRLRRLQAELTHARRDLVRARTRAEQLVQSIRDRSSRWASSAHQVNELLKMSVAFRRLSEARNEATALWAVKDVAINVVGTENFVLLARDAKDQMLPIAGMGAVFDETVREAPTLAELGESGDRVVSLHFGGEVVGALVIRRLLDHRPPLSLADEQVIRLLSHFAATAIVAARRAD